MHGTRNHERRREVTKFDFREGQTSRKLSDQGRRNARQQAARLRREAERDHREEIE